MTIQRSASSTANDYGEKTEIWSDVDTIYAAVNSLEGKESWKAKQVTPEATTELMIRYYSDISTKDRIKWGSRYLNIISIVPDAKNTQQVLLCQDRV